MTPLARLDEFSDFFCHKKVWWPKGAILNSWVTISAIHSIWNTFLNRASGGYRPLGPTELDGVDLQIDQVGPQNLYGYHASEMQDASEGEIILTVAQDDTSSSQFSVQQLKPSSSITFGFDFLYVYARVYAYTYRHTHTYKCVCVIC